MIDELETKDRPGDESKRPPQLSGDRQGGGHLGHSRHQQGQEAGSGRSRSRGYIPVVDPDHFGFDLDRHHRPAHHPRESFWKPSSKISEDRRVAAVYDITGEWDSLVIGYFRGRDDLNDFIKGILSLPICRPDGDPSRSERGEGRKTRPRLTAAIS